MNTETTAGVIGLGIMGGAFARHLADAGIRTLGYDVLPGRVDALEANGGVRRTSAREVAAGAEVVITSLPHAAALEESLFGERGVISAAHPNLLLIETSTLPLEVKEKARSRCAAAGVGMLDAPVSGTGAQAQRKDICVLASGELADFERARGMLSHIARSVRYVGAFGAGSKIKYIANLLVAVHTVAAAEALVLGEKAGLDLASLLDVLLDSAATSRMLEVRGPSMIDGSYEAPMMKVEVFQKDIEIISGFARQSASPFPYSVPQSPS
ncbi:MAG: NAD(P)-dependent oxidoreductase [Terriglobia bacterium]|nr:MAG: NAD(P)-dependent oxidoreductase [Terriglobia bacterium]